MASSPAQPSTYEYMNATQAELVTILYSLQSHWNILEEELVEINKDIIYMRECLAKYGENFRIPLEYLKEMKREKKETMKKIIENMDNFEMHVRGGRSLVQDLNRQQTEQRNEIVAQQAVASGSGGGVLPQNSRPQHRLNPLNRSRESFRRAPTDVLSSSTMNDTVYVTSGNMPQYKLISKGVNNGN